jgi:ligand-binding sensor protein
MAVVRSDIMRVRGQSEKESCWLGEMIGRFEASQLGDLLKYICECGTTNPPQYSVATYPFL